MTNTEIAAPQRLFSAMVIVSALGYFVDVYDLVLFSTVRIPSLRGIGVPEADFFNTGVFLLNCQMAGMLLGGLLWGIVGDKQGRLAILFGSIFLYSVANIANAFITSLDQYAVLRFVAGVGLAGELGGAVTLVSESMDREKRGYGTSLIAAFGMLGAITAALVAGLVEWRTSYIIGGALGLLLLFARMKMCEPGMYDRVREKTDIVRGSLLMLLRPRERFMRYVAGIMIGVPTYYLIVIFMTFAPEMTGALGAVEKLTASEAVIALYVGLSVGSIASGIISQKLRSRKKTLGLFLFGMLVLTAIYLLSPEGMSATYYGALTLGLGFFCGYFAVFMMVSAEQFGTNIRALTATSTANFVRAATIPVSGAYAWLKSSGMAYEQAAIAIGIVCFAVAFWGLSKARETFGADLDYTEK